ncbi:hypothetical protein BJX61DRAFT_539843 [Aspergillus egyptiacus]|nr:hypothetical protein BJX61DRAFT_539843 [Aspergillus egyptiacus]
METVPPSYQTATTRDAWSIIAHYIPSSDLCAAALVCQKWHAIFTPFLWGNPASHFGTENDEVYVALTRFRKTLKYTRLEVRMLTHTLHMPPALSEIYGGPRPEWLRDIFEYLPCLQSLVVSELPFFDHSAMMALRGATSNGASSRTYNVRLLVADGEPNTTSQGIAETLIRFPELIYLDLSYTTPAKDQTVLSALSQLERLQVLKLRGIGLKDIDAEFLANAVTHRVRVLDLRNNKLTDAAVLSLVSTCFLPPGHSLPGHGPRSRTAHSLNSIDHFSPFFPSSNFLRSPALDAEFRRALTSPLTGRSWVESLPNDGLTHLYIADNQITVDAAAALLSTARLHVLDVGTLFSPSNAGRHGFAGAGAEKLIPILSTLGRESLTYLRAHHSICTSPAPQGKDLLSDYSLPELSAESRMLGINELDTTTTEIHELPADVTPVFELPGSIPQPLQPSDDEREGDNVDGVVYNPEHPPAARRGSIFAPEVLHDSDDTNGTITQSSEPSPSDCGCTHLHSPIPWCSSPVYIEDFRVRKIRELLAKRPKSQRPRRNGRESFTYLHPSQIPRIERLVLTDVPSHVSADSPILEMLINFIAACSNEALLATLQAGSDYSLPPGKDRARAEQERAKSLFPLRQLVLEISPVTNAREPLRTTGWKSVSAQMGHQKSTTGDWDLEMLWSAASDDFSFFGETERGIPEYDQARYSSMAAPKPDYDDLRVPELAASFPSRVSLQNSENLLGRPISQSRSAIPSTALAPIVDLVAELASFRRRKKLEHEQAVRNTYQRRCEALSPQSCYSKASARAVSPSSGQRTLSPAPGLLLPIAHHVEGHWKGEVKVVRNATPKGRSGMVDIYGNYFEKGYLYP